MPGYFKKTEGQIDTIWADGLFVLDSNVLLNLYGYTEKMREDLLGLLWMFKDRLWIPAQVAEEFHRRRLNVINERKAAYPDVHGVLNRAQKSITNKIKEIHEDSGIETRDLLKNVKESFDAFKTETDRLEKASAVRSMKPTDNPEDDEIWQAVLDILHGRTGKGLSQERKRAIFDEEGPRRYENEMPPGYEDSGKLGDRKFGDLIIWFEILSKAKEVEKPVLLLTDDQKNDWYRKSNGKPSGPHPELVNELYEEAGVTFHALPPHAFLKQGSERFGVKISQEAADAIDEETKPSKAEDDYPFEIEDRLDELMASDRRSLHAYMPIQDMRTIGELIRDSDVRGVARRMDIHEIQRQVDAVKQARRLIDVDKEIRGAEKTLRDYEHLKREMGL